MRWVRGGAKAVFTRKEKKAFINFFSLAGRSPATCWTADVMAAWQMDNGHNQEHCCFLLFSLSFYCSSWHYKVQSIAVVNAQHCPSCVPCQLLAQGRARWQPEEQRKPWPCASTVWQLSTHPAVGAVLVTKPKHRTLWAAVKKINSVSARPCRISTFGSASFSWCSGPPLSNTCSSATTPFPILYAVFLCPSLTLWTTFIKCL